MIFVIIIVGILLWFISSYNGFIRLRNRVQEAWADIDVQLKRRYDLIPNLVETVKGYASHERDTFEAVVEARNKAMSAEATGDVAAISRADAGLAGTLKTLFALSERYPELKANANFLELQRELSDTEDKIQAARRFYNAIVQDYNTAVQVFPSNVVASAFDFTPEAFYELEEGSMEREPVQVDFNQNK